MRNIMLPLSKPALSTLTIFTFCGDMERDYLGPPYLFNLHQRQAGRFSFGIQELHIYRAVFFRIWPFDVKLRLWYL